MDRSRRVWFEAWSLVEWWEKVVGYEFGWRTRVRATGTRKMRKKVDG